MNNVIYITSVLYMQYASPVLNRLDENLNNIYFILRMNFNYYVYWRRRHPINAALVIVLPFYGGIENRKSIIIIIIIIIICRVNSTIIGIVIKLDNFSTQLKIDGNWTNQVYDIL